MLLALQLPLRFIRKGQRIEFCDMEPPTGLMEKWIARRDNQIMGLELLSIALGEKPVAARFLLALHARRDCRHQYVWRTI